MIQGFVCFFVAILFHEIGHISFSKVFKVNLQNLKFSFFGGSIEIKNNICHKKLTKIIVYFSGPFMNFLLIILTYFVNIDINVKLLFILTNFYIALFNLLPILPLDGGNIIREILKIKYDLLKSNKISLIISKIFLVILAFIYSILIIKIKNISLFSLIIYLWYLNIIESKKIENLERAYMLINNSSK